HSAHAPDLHSFPTRRSSDLIGLDVHPHGSSKMVYLSATTEYNSNLNYEDMVLFENTFKTGWNPGEINHVSIYRNGSHIILYLNVDRKSTRLNSSHVKTSYAV